jgi:flagellar hook-associated protein 1 FlgK
MGASPLMMLGMRAMAANYAALQVTGHNIANANVEGYSRQRAELSTALGQFSGAGYFGKGSDVETITRTHNAFLTREALKTTSLAEMDRARLEQLRQLENVFPTGERGLGHATSEFMNALSDLALRPADSASRQVVLARADELAARFADADGQLVTLQQLLREDLKVTVATVNEITRNIADVNQQIAAVRGLGQPPNDLLDQRDRLLADLSGYISVTTVEADDGTLGVFAGGGQRLVLSNDAQPLAVVDDPNDPSRAAIAVMDNGIPLRLKEDTLGGGRIAGLLRFQNQDLVQAQVLIGQMAAAITGAVNAQQRLGVNLHEPVGSVPSQDLFSAPVPHVQPAAANAKDAAGQFIGQVGLTIVRPSELQASEYAMVADPLGTPGVWQVTRLSDGLVRSVASGDEIDGLRIDVGVPAPVAGDKFLLQPVTRAASGLTTRLRDPRDIAAASALTATVGAANTGTAAIGGLTITSGAVDPQLRAALTFTDDAGAYAWELRDRTTNALVSSGVGTWVPGQALPAAPDPDINGFALTLTGAPRNGDTLTIDRTLNVAASNGNALAMNALRDLPLVGRVRLPDGSLAGGASATDAYAAAMSDIGVRVQGASAIADISGALARQAEQTRSSDAGVNLDEEAARLIEFQQSYQAAAKVLQVAQQIFETLLQTAGG